MCSVLHKTICIGRVDGVSRFRVSVRAGSGTVLDPASKFPVSNLSPPQMHTKVRPSRCSNSLDVWPLSCSSRKTAVCPTRFFRVRVTAHSTAVECVCVCEKNTYKSSVFSMDPRDPGGDHWPPQLRARLPWKGTGPIHVTGGQALPLLLINCHGGREQISISFIVRSDTPSPPSHPIRPPVHCLPPSHRSSGRRTFPFPPFSPLVSTPRRRRRSPSEGCFFRQTTTSNRRRTFISCTTLV